MRKYIIFPDNIHIYFNNGYQLFYKLTLMCLLVYIVFATKPLKLALKVVWKRFFFRATAEIISHLLEIFRQRKYWRAPLVKCRLQSRGGNSDGIPGDCGPAAGRHWPVLTGRRTDRTAASCPGYSGRRTRCQWLWEKDGHVGIQTRVSVVTNPKLT